MRPSRSPIAGLLLFTCMSSLVGCAGERYSTTDAGDLGSEAPLDAGIDLDSGPNDTSSATDLGPADTGPDVGADVGLADAGPVDLGSMDAGPVDIGIVPREITLGTAARPATLITPDDYDGTPHPMIVLIHGLGSDSGNIAQFFPLGYEVDDRDFFLLIPNGTQAADGTRFWDATDQCCNNNYTSTPVDDVGYITGLLDDVSGMFNIDPRRVYATGHSNGGFMSYRLACDVPERFAAIAPLAGMEPRDATLCTPSEAVSVLHAHGTADEVITYDGIVQDTVQYYPPAEEVVERWATRAGCTLGSRTQTGTLDLTTDVAGSETDAFAYGSGCQAGIDVRLWKINGASHVPALTDAFFEGVLDFLLSHQKP